MNAPERTRIKICGLTREQDVDAAVAAGADAVGFIMYGKSPRHVTIERAAQLASRLPVFMVPVLLFVNETPARVMQAFAHIANGPVTRYELPKLRAFNFVIENALGGGVTISLNQDVHGKSLSSVMLEIELPGDPA